MYHYFGGFPSKDLKKKKGRVAKGRNATTRSQDLKRVAYCYDRYVIDSVLKTQGMSGKGQDETTKGDYFAIAVIGRATPTRSYEERRSPPLDVFTPFLISITRPTRNK
jgi:hypothetical protein